MEKEILLAQPRGFCAGVDRAIEIVERALAQFGAPVYVRHEIVHNAYVVEGRFLLKIWPMRRQAVIWFSPPMGSLVPSRPKRSRVA
jgi:hypothetical protein